jgi:2-keto-4-pentenoate hydratase/2-oxohepta-3-ene-1,7-dioic acid hydratase in catechol pathway
MKLISFVLDGQTRAGLWLGEQVLDLAAAAAIAGENVDLSSVLAIARGGNGQWQTLRRIEKSRAAFGSALLAVRDVQLLAPIPVPARNPFCVGRNYLDHVKEGYAKRGADLKLPEVPQFFTKATHAINAPGAAVRLDARVTQLLDYEVELAIIIGRGGRDIVAEQAYEHIFGYTIANDVTARDLQRRHDQWFKGKSLDTTLPMGPWIIDPEEIGDPRTLELSLTVNGQERQRAKVAQMIFDIPAIIASLSAGLTLEAGDIICTGTPAGVGYAMEPAQRLRDGDVVAARIDRIGVLESPIVEVSPR